MFRRGFLSSLFGGLFAAPIITEPLGPDQIELVALQDGEMFYDQEPNVRLSREDAIRLRDYLNQCYPPAPGGMSFTNPMGSFRF